MSAEFRRSRPFWRAPEARIVRPELWLVAVVVLGMLLVEVWQSSRMTELCLALEHQRGALKQERSRLEFDRARFERSLTRSELEPLAMRLGLAPVDGRQQIELPGSYLSGAGAAKAATVVPRMAWLDRVGRALVPDAVARSRSGS